MSVKPRFHASQGLARIARQHPRYQGCVGHWLANERTGITLRDISGQGHNITLLGSIAPPVWVSNRFGPTVLYDGIDDSGVNQSIPSTLDLSLPWTLMGWFNLISDTGTHGIIFGFDSSDATNERVNLRIETGTLVIKVASNGKTPGSGSSISLGTWYHVGIVWDGTQIHIYKNGVLDYSDTPSSAIIWSELTALRVGAQDILGGGNENRANAYIENLRLYKRPVPGGEIAKHYQNPNLEFNSASEQLRQYSWEALAPPSVSSAASHYYRRLMG